MSQTETFDFGIDDTGKVTRLIAMLEHLKSTGKEFTLKVTITRHDPETDDEDGEYSDFDDDDPGDDEDEFLYNFGDGGSERFQIPMPDHAPSYFITPEGSDPLYFPTQAGLNLMRGER